MFTDICKSLVSLTMTIMGMLAIFFAFKEQTDIAILCMLVAIFFKDDNP